MTWFTVLKETEEAPMDEEMPMEDMPMDDMGGDMGGEMPMGDMGEEPVEEGSQPRNLHGGEEFQVDPENDENVEKWFTELKKKKDETVGQAALRGVKNIPRSVVQGVKGAGKAVKETVVDPLVRDAKEVRDISRDFRFRNPLQLERDEKGKVKDLSVRLPVEHSERAMLNNPDVYDLSTARRDPSSKGKYGHKVGGRLQADLLEDRTEQDGVIVEQDPAARNTKDRFFGQKPRSRRPADPYANTRREYKQQQKMKLQTEKQIQLVQQKIEALERKKEKLSFDKKQLPIADVNQMNQLNQQKQTLSQTLQENEGKLQANKNFLDPQANYLESEYIREQGARRAVSPQWQKELQTSKLGGARIRGGQKPSVQPYGSPRGRNKVNNPRPKGFIQQWQDQLRGGN